MLDQETRIHLLPLKETKALEALEDLFKLVVQDLRQQMSGIALDDPQVDRKLLIARARIDGAQKTANLVIDYLTKHLKA